MRIFFDTEFTGLTRDAALVSIGLIDETGTHAFYAELSDTYVPEECSLFCREHVLPLLDGGAARLPLIEVRHRLLQWLTAQGPHTVLVCDSRRDVSQLQQLFPDGLPLSVSMQVLGVWGQLKRRVLNRDRRIHRKFGLRVHHALDDARVNRIMLR